jgi:hypothetical protein
MRALAARRFLAHALYERNQDQKEHAPQSALWRG